MAAQEVRDLGEVLPFDCPVCGGRDVVEKREWRGGTPPTGEWRHFFACDYCGHDLTPELAAENARAVRREEIRRGAPGDSLTEEPDG